MIRSYTILVTVLLLGAALTSSNRHLGFSKSVLAGNQLQGFQIPIPEVTMTAYQQLVVYKTLRYVIFKLNDQKTHLVPETIGPLTATYENFLKDIPLGVLRYALYYPDPKENRNKSPIVSFYLTPTNVSNTERDLFLMAFQNHKMQCPVDDMGIHASDHRFITYNMVHGII